MTEIINGFVQAYSGLPPWLQDLVKLYAFPLGFIFFGLKGLETSFKQYSTKRIHWSIPVLSPYILGIGWQVYNHPEQAVKSIFGGIGLGLIANFLHFMWDKRINKYKKEQDKQ